MNKYVKIALILLAVGIIAGLGVFYWAFNKPHRDVAAEKAEFTIEAKAFFAEFQQDENAANSKYNDKVVEVSGSLFGVNPDEKGFSLILENEMEGVTCVLDSAYSAENSQKILGLSVGAPVKLKGRCVGLDLIQGVMVDNCVLIE
jgi:hypothetical protein